MPLSADDINRAFAALSLELEGQHRRAEIVVVGGAALVLLFRARDSTKDVDAYAGRLVGGDAWNFMTSFERFSPAT